jgi:hypothetical protein
MKGPAIFLAQVAGTAPPFDDFAASGADAKTHARILGLDQQ